MNVAGLGYFHLFSHALSFSFRFRPPAFLHRLTFPFIGLQMMFCFAFGLAPTCYDPSPKFSFYPLLLVPKIPDTLRNLPAPSRHIPSNHCQSPQSTRPFPTSARTCRTSSHLR